MLVVTLRRWGLSPTQPDPYPEWIVRHPHRNPHRDPHQLLVDARCHSRWTEGSSAARDRASSLNQLPGSGLVGPSPHDAALDTRPGSSYVRLNLAVPRARGLEPNPPALNLGLPPRKSTALRASAST